MISSEKWQRKQSPPLSPSPLAKEAVPDCHLASRDGFIDSECQTPDRFVVGEADAAF